ncbi:hypothetical protein GTP46_25740 [Duganella sp. FT135W]|uniref:Lipase helper protein n=1 Tax=Duganella flavida TaxID=2692175 RepID=A0A6L8KF46_9BURK|nr:lipase secretion chaperone [Duganella flavida]MYM26036.1 hypothetical protein [Duganella flavida]
MKPALAGAAALLVALIALIALLAAQPATAPSPAPAVAATSEARAPSAAAARFFRELGNADPGPQIEIALTDTQELIPDFALREVMDHYLLARSDAGRLQALREHLRRTLPPTASREAEQLAQNYSDYLAAHGALLAAQNFHDTPDLGRLAAWQQQQRQLRLRMLGARVNEEWFGADDAYLTQALEEAGRNADAPSANDDEARHRQHMQQVLRSATRQPPTEATARYGAQ